MLTSERIVGYQQWRDLLFVHQPVGADVLHPLLPPSLAVDTFDGQAWITLIPFAIVGSRPVGAPPALGMDFLEVNLRTYVRAPDGEPGIYFFSLEASSWLAVAGARLTYGLPYFPSAMLCRTRPDGARVYQSTRRGLGAGPMLEAAWQVGAATGTAAPGSLDHFLIERYALFVTRRNRLYRARVQHRPYPLFRASVETLRESLCAAAGLPALALPSSLAHHSSGVDVAIGWRRPV